MNHAIYLVYINGQSTKPLVHSIEEAKRYATRHIAYKPSLRIECYSMPHLISQWIYDYQAAKWWNKSSAGLNRNELILIQEVGTGRKARYQAIEELPLRVKTNGAPHQCVPHLSLEEFRRFLRTLFDRTLNPST